LKLGAAVTILKPSEDGKRVELLSATELPQASAFLWNKKLLLQLNCRGYVVSQFMQPEPSKYSRGPMPEQSTFMLPEHKYYAHHPGRFVYMKDEDGTEIFSIPHEPVRNAAESFTFSVGKADVVWRIARNDLVIRLAASIPVDDVVELWTLEVENTGPLSRRLSIYPCFSIGYMSWMNQSASYRADLGGVVASSVTPYQKLEDYCYVNSLKDKTFLLHDVEPLAWETSQSSFEGEGGLHDPDGVRNEQLGDNNAAYETLIAALQYRDDFGVGQTRRYNFIFGPAKDDAEIIELRKKYLSESKFDAALTAYEEFQTAGSGCVRIDTPDPHLNNFVNHWLGRQVFYHGDANRLTTDPQTRNYLQDNMGMVYVNSDVTRGAFLYALAQQKPDGAMPDGVLLKAGAELKNINQVPHADHSVWLPVCLEAYLDETNDYSVLKEIITGHTVADRMNDAMQSLINNCDERNLSLIAQGDWCDPMNMVGHKGSGVSSWLSMATVHALNTWAKICRRNNDAGTASQFEDSAKKIAASVQEYFWDSNWFARGITDNGVPFGIDADEEGKIFLNPQSWSILSGIATDEQKEKIIESLESHLDTPYGMMTLAPAYTAMRDDVGRLTQKHPGTTENGAVYSHAVTFYISALFKMGDSDRAYEQLSRLIPGPDETDLSRRGQLPVFIPNYYRGAIHQFSRSAGRSSHLFNTGAASWMYRSVVEQLFGLRGNIRGLAIEPNLPSTWQSASASRTFRGANLEVSYRRDAGVDDISISVDGTALASQQITDIKRGETYRVEVRLPTT